MPVFVNSTRGGLGATGLLTLLALVAMAILPDIQVMGYEGILGDFCRNRKPEECCEKRLDDCSVPIYDTLCYCDEFCITDIDQPKNDDCCPDFREVCLGEKPSKDDPGPYILADCEKDGVNIKHGDSHKFNCNECKCAEGQLLCEEDECMVEEKEIRTVNQRPLHYGWRASNYSNFWGRKAKDGLMLRTGSFIPEELSMKMNPIALRPDVSQIPSRFDARTKREWLGRVSDVRDQGWCGASWAFSTIGVTQDRLAIIAKGRKPFQLSVQNLLSCAKLGQKECEGGYVDRAWNYLRKTGVVSEKCYRYDSGSTNKVSRCLIRSRDTSALQCEHKHQYKTEPAYRISSNVEDIQWEILNDGPVQAMMEVHKDLFMYKSGIYSYSGVTKGETASHSVRIIGWGEDPLPGSRPVKYWLVANSWGKDWGENGLFKIRRGTNESGIETFVLAVRVRLANYVYGV
ncbi:uncharacterized peptidase C1-like protein F26E4.3 [Homarus americanus]|uniref:uncharacterized peptidase C1-like protein F26E4.3 n=1 Tax=Homarus americanus TaxID=6706 RepID=UPI001C44005F|nr:uncharacterized peptidase C1-like protein F26E4.3 [Homarus americanus]